LHPGAAAGTWANARRTFTQNISQDFSTSSGNDIVTLKGSKFALELMGVTSANALTTANFTF